MKLTAKELAARAQREALYARGGRVRCTILETRVVTIPNRIEATHVIAKTA